MLFVCVQWVYLRILDSHDTVERIIGITVSKANGEKFMPDG